MANIQDEYIRLMQDKAMLVGAKLVTLPSNEAIAAYIIDVCMKKSPCELLIPEKDIQLGPVSKYNNPTRLERIIAAPNMPNIFAAIKQQAAPDAITCIEKNLDRYLAGYDVGVARACLGIAELGTCLLISTDEDVRLATMTCEISIIVLRAQDIVLSLAEAAPYIREAQMGNAASYLAFITGASRTADIERVLTVGAHGPLALHIIIEVEGLGC